MSVSEVELRNLCDKGYGEYLPGMDGPDGFKVVNSINTFKEQQDQDGGFAAVIFQKPGPPEETVVVFRGTDFSTYGDTATDVDLAVGVDNPQYAAAADFIRANSGSLTGNITFAGHSLGGNIAMDRALESGLDVDCVTFNAPGFSDEYVEAHGNFADHKGSITEFQNERDIVSSVGDHPGEVVIVEGTGGILGLNHDLSDLATEGDSLVRSGSGMKDGRCYVVQALTDVVDKIAPDGGVLHTLVKGILYVGYGAFSVNQAVGWLTAGVIAGAIVAVIGIKVLLIAAIAIVLAVVVIEASMWLAERIVDAAQWLAEWIEGGGLNRLVDAAIEIVRGAFEELVRLGHMAADLVGGLLSAVTQAIKDIAARLVDKFSALLDKLRGRGNGALGAISANLAELADISQRLRRTQGRIASVDRKLGRLAFKIEPEQKLAVSMIDWSVDRGWAVSACAAYAETSLIRLESCERAILKSAPRRR